MNAKLATMGIGSAATRSAFKPFLRIALAGMLGGIGFLGTARPSYAQAPEIKPQPPQPAPHTVSQETPPAELVLFDGKTLNGWVESDFAGRGEVKVENGQILLGMGVMTGVTYTNTNALPKMNYEVTLEARRVEGSDFFCGLTFPVSKDSCSLILGGWGGGLVGLSCLDGEDAANNETTQFMNFEKGRWYKVRLRVTPDKIQAWIDGEKLVDATITDRRISIRFEVEPCVPFGIATYATTGAARNLRIRRL